MRTRVVVALLAAQAGFGQSDASAAREKLRPALVTVIARDPQGKEIARGAGFFASRDGQVIASGHTLHNAASAEVRTAAGDVYPVQIVVGEGVSAEILRLAVELREGQEVPFLEISETEPHAREPVAVVAGAQAKIFQGAVLAVRNVSALGSVLQITARIPPEASGAPVINAQGEVIGVAMWEAAGGKASFAAAGETVNALRISQPKALSEWNGAAPTKAFGEPEILYREGLARLLVQDFEEALASFEEAVAKDPRYAEAWFHAGFTKGKLGRQKEKIEAYRKAIELKPDYADARYSLGVSYALTGQGKLAIEEYQILKKLDPTLADKLAILIEAVIHEDHAEPPKPGATKALGRAPVSVRDRCD